MNRQRGFGLIAYGIGALVFIAAIGGLIYAVQHWCNSACQEQSDRADRAEASIRVAQERATAIALLWAGKVTQEDTHAREREADRTTRFAPVVVAARNLPAAVARGVFPIPAARVLDDAIRASNTAPTRSASEPAKEPTPVAPSTEEVDEVDEVDVSNVVDWGVTVASLYTACTDQVRGWQDFYHGLQQATQ